MHRQSINFTDPNAEWIKTALKTNEYNSASELINDLIRQRRRQDYQAEQSAIRTLVLEGIASGTTDLTAQDIKQQVIKRKQESGI